MGDYQAEAVESLSSEPSQEVIEDWLGAQLAFYCQGTETKASVYARAKGILDRPKHEEGIVTGVSVRDQTRHDHAD